MSSANVAIRSSWSPNCYAMGNCVNQYQEKCTLFGLLEAVACMVEIKQGCALSGLYIDEICKVIERLATSGACLVVVAYWY